uniref:Transporter n=1 Tax=Syphacia muris TaxID=451379 RepID=A0A0N5ADH0_9BILA
MWFEERSWSNLKMSSLIVEEWRDLWSTKVDLFVVLLSYVFATTNFLNFPRLLFTYGGLAFVVAYAAALILCAFPIIVMELAVGQLTGRAPPLAIYNLCPLFKGVGVAQVLFSLFLISHLARFLGWLIIYFGHLIWAVIVERPGLPWLNCGTYPEFNDFPCLEAGSVENITLHGVNKLCVLTKQSTITQFMRTFDQPSSGITEVGNFQLYMLGALGIVWILAFMAICFGVRWLGKVIHFSFITPLVLLAIMMVRALTLTGVMEIFEEIYNLTNWDMLTGFEIWRVAIEQALLATGVGFGTFITISSYCKHSNNLIGDSLLLLFGHGVLTLMQVLTTVGLIGFVRYRTSLSADYLLEQGEAQMWYLLSYMKYIPDVRIWTGILLVLFIFSLLNIVYLLSLNVLSSLEDFFGEKWSKCFLRFCLALFVCCLGCALGLHYTTQGGYYAHKLVSVYFGIVTLWIILLFELIAVGWFYCAFKLGKDLRSMLSSTCSWCFGQFILLFIYLLPVVIGGLIYFKILDMNLTMDKEISSWKYANIVGWAIACAPLLPIPLYIITTFCRTCTKGPGVTKIQRLKNTISSPLRLGVVKSTNNSVPRYTTAAPGYVLLPQAPLAEPENYTDVSHKVF